MNLIKVNGDTRVSSELKETPWTIGRIGGLFPIKTFFYNYFILILFRKKIYIYLLRGKMVENIEEKERSIKK